jgi:glucosamine--fructose-6-phosphate aminotransferase (isomerizing)
MIGQHMESEIREQPAALARVSSLYLSKLESALGGSRPEMVLLVARGSSDHAALYARYLFEIHLGIPVTLAAPSVITRFGAKIKYPPCLAVGISQSGAGPDVAEVLAAMRKSGHRTLAVTNTEGSRLTQTAEASLLLDVGMEQSVAATKTYTSSLLAMYQLARVLGADLPDPELPTQDWLEKCRVDAQEACPALIRNQVIFSLGRGYSFPTCQETALKLMECSLLPAKAYSTADFEHGPKALAGPGSAAIAYGDPPEGLDAFGCTPILAPRGPEGPSSVFWEIFFGQWLALHAARVRGLDPDKPRNLSKVTQTL